jgi:hypothetical protein
MKVSSTSTAPARAVGGDAPQPHPQTSRLDTSPPR